MQQQITDSNQIQEINIKVQGDVYSLKKVVALIQRAKQLFKIKYQIDRIR